MNSKLQKVDPAPVGQYIKGTEAGNFYLVVAETDDGIVGFRPLSTAVPAKGSSPSKGVQTRVRVVPVENNSAVEKLMDKFGFAKRNGGVNPVHYSQVTNDPATAIKDAKFILNLAA